MTYDIYLINPQCIVYGYNQKLEYEMAKFYTTIASGMSCNNLSSQPIQLKALGSTKSYSNMRSTSNTTKSSSNHNLYHSASEVVGNKLGHPSYFVINGQGAESSSNMSIVHQV